MELFSERKGNWQEKKRGVTKNKILYFGVPALLGAYVIRPQQAAVYRGGTTSKLATGC